MGTEWSKNSKYNSFNSYKGLTYYEHYKKVVGWLEGRNVLPPPIEASLDPINMCNQKCYYCNSQSYLREHPTGFRAWTRQTMEHMLDRMENWGVKAFCWGGGGEALLNANLHGMTAYGVNLGMEASIITNGSLMEPFIDELILCRWVGISLDSAVPEVYRKVRGIDDCSKVLSNIKKLVFNSDNTDVAVKVLLLPETIDSIVETCKIVRDLGVDDFHVRPVDLERKDYHGPKGVSFDEANVRRTFDKCHALETPDFRVYTVTHKYDDSFKVKHDFNHCLASPLVVQICTDEKMYVCVDHRLEARFEIDKWGSDEHRNLLLGIEPCNECSRCTWSEYNRQVQEVVIEDRMCRNFP